MTQNRMLIYIGGAVFAVIIIIVIAAITQNRTAIDITSLIPDDITVTVDGKKVKSTGKVKVDPGSHTVIAEREGFESKTYKFDLKQDQVKKIDITLIANSGVGTKWLNDNVAKQYQAEARGSQAHDKEVADARKKTPLITLLPMLRRDWRIDYGRSQQHPDDPEAIAIIITSVNETAKQHALEWIEQQGYKPQDYEIIYRTP